MSCSPFDLRDYYLKELTDPQQRQVESHVQDCSACREELDRLRLTGVALLSLREEEIPQRIAFVSDPVFEPSRAARWWAAFWGSPARLGFAGAALLSATLLFSTLTRTAGTSAGGGLSAAEVDRRIQAAIASSEARQTATTTRLVQDLVDRVNTEHYARLVAEDDARIARQDAYKAEIASGDYVTLASNQGGLK
jgi:anti-sigma factor RsiW